MGNILAFIETRDNKIKNNGYEVASVASKIARETGSNVSALLIGDSVTSLTQNLSPYGIGKVYIAEDPRLKLYSSTVYGKIFAQVVNMASAEIVLFSATSMGKDLGPVVCAKLGAGLVSDCTDIRVTEGTIIAKRPVYAGKAIAEVKVNSTLKMFSLRPNVFKPEETASNSDVQTEKITLELSDDDFRVKVTDVVVSTEKLDVTEARVVVSGGRGLKGPENFYLIEDLAKVLGGAAGASRAVVDAGWRPHGDQVGQTGKTVSPDLYIAVGISGAIQHLAGMSSSKCIVAINKDKDAPIFQIADYGLIGDALEILPVLTDEFKKVLSN
ncbi:MAG: electron transfer flavoprotein subunit alpha/FixB family protein [Ignavibacteria bacterium]|nr:electron transfer flavoprotein subunit alpha/FixB family protein [Ignavibacteria bacterium]